MNTSPSATDRVYRYTKDAVLARYHAGGDLVSERGDRDQPPTRAPRLRTRTAWVT
ncbi:hypothetical protein [Halostreptopolyspora alba]|uniref:hypothetical protein n=1 Tax=Halostreptopolyspora alba TaxID=2487137 RepID=UPI003712C615